MRRWGSVAGGLFLGCSLLAAQAAPPEREETPPRPADFAFAIPIEAAPGAAHLRFDVPPAVYQKALRSDLGDLRVFNAAGEVVPHALVDSPPTRSRSESSRELKFFPLKTRGESRSVEGLEIVARRSAAGTVLEVRDRGKQTGRERLVGYILDLGQPDKLPTALALDWAPREEGFLGSVRVEAGDDLKSWRTVAAAAPVASLAFGGQTLTERRVRLAGEKARFLRLSWPPGQPELTLTGVTAEFSAETRSVERAWIDAVPAGSANKPGEYGFDLGARAAVDRLRLELPQLNTIVAVSIASRADPKADWRPVAGGMVYRLSGNGAGELTSPDIEIAPNTHRYWMVRVDQRGGGLGNGPLRLSAAHVRQQIVFVARGNGPFQLGVGSASARPGAFPVASLVPGYTDDALQKIPVVRAGELRIAGGEQRLKPPPEPVPWRRYGLWAVLVLAVAVMGTMAYRLLKQAG